MAITADQVKELRDQSGAGVMECKRALVEAKGNLAQAMEVLKQQGLAQVSKRSDRAASQGIVEAYIHGGGRIGVLVEVNCETDFVARTEEFRALAHDLAMQIAFSNPPTVGELEGEPAAASANLDEVPLMQQPFIKDPKLTVADLVRDTAAKTRENVVVRRFVRYELGV